jgi:hypothetical protein
MSNGNERALSGVVRVILYFVLYFVQSVIRVSAVRVRFKLGHHMDSTTAEGFLATVFRHYTMYAIWPCWFLHVARCNPYDFLAKSLVARIR